MTLRYVTLHHGIAGLYEQLCAAKLVITEPSNVSGEVFDDAITSYRWAS